MAIKDVQSLINQRADARLESDIDTLSRQLYGGVGYNLLIDIKVNVGTAEAPKVCSLAHILSGSGYRQKIIELNTETYRQEEAENFLRKVESLKSDVDELLNLKNNDY